MKLGNDGPHSESDVSDKNCLSYWFPRLVIAGVPVPRTVIIDAGDNWHDLYHLLDGKTPPIADNLASSIRDAADPLGYPAFLRTGQGSGKHSWKDCCFLASPEAVPSHIASLIEWSECVDFLGLCYRIWAVREMLPVEPVAVLPRYGNMPLVKEVRCFIAGGAIVCQHPYWPPGSIADGFGMRSLSPRGGVREGSLEDAARLAAAIHGSEPATDDEPRWRPIAEQVARAFADDGAWSVDLLATNRGWFVTDMAEAKRSFHWEGCPHALGLRGSP